MTIMATRRRFRTQRSVSYDRPAEVLAVLQHARSIVEAGWVQNRWTGTATSAGGAVGGDGSARRAGGGVADGSGRACLVGAVALAVRARDPRADLAVGTGPALAFVADAVLGERAAGRSAPHHVRVQRMRELARWNDEPGRTRADVVAALDRAAAAVVARVVQPA